MRANAHPKETMTKYGTKSVELTENKTKRYNVLNLKGADGVLCACTKLISHRKSTN